MAGAGSKGIGCSPRGCPRVIGIPEKAKMTGRLISVVVIGLDEEQHLRGSLDSVFAACPAGDELEVIYVDSGSRDRSLEIAGSFPSVRVVELGDPEPSASKGRNAGIRVARGEWLQLLDGDSLLDPGWLTKALPRLEEQAGIACVFGRCEEVRPRQSLYMRVCQFDWSIPPGDYRLCGGNALWRREAILRAGGFDPELVVGEEPDLCYRVRQQGGRIVCLDLPMVRHDLDMNSFGDYWRRAARSGRGYVQIGLRFRRGEEKLWLRETVRNFLEPFIWLALLVAGFLLGGVAGALGLLAAYLVFQVVRVAWRARKREGGVTDPLLYGVHCLFSRIPLFCGQLQGLPRAWRERNRGGRADGPG